MGTNNGKEDVLDSKDNNNPNSQYCIKMYTFDKLEVSMSVTAALKIQKRMNC